MLMLISENRVRCLDCEFPVAPALRRCRAGSHLSYHFGEGGKWRNMACNIYRVFRLHVELRGLLARAEAGVAHRPGLLL